MRETCQLALDTTSAQQTRNLGTRLGGRLAGGDVLALAGDLGTGKTAFAQGIAAGLGIRAAITSPTFILVNRYTAPEGCILHHADCYRLADAPAEMWDIGLTDLYAEEGAIVVIEWADRIPGLLPAEYLEVRFTYLDEERRRLCFIGHGARFVELVSWLVG